MTTTPIMIRAITTSDRRFPLPPGDGSDAVHTNPTYAYAVTELHTDRDVTGIGLAFTLGTGNDLVTQAIALLAEPLLGQEIEALMADFGSTLNALANHPALRWLGPHAGVIHLALSSIVNACWDLWAKARGVPLWQLILDLSPEALVATLDLSYLEDVLTADQAIALLRAEAPRRAARMPILTAGYPGYDTSFGWFGYADAQIRDNAARAVANGFDALKLKVGHRDPARDIARARLVRATVGPD
ncbi:MAG: enolase C-terminal domain-like protein, partial [Thermomicrobiales bacterium]